MEWTIADTVMLAEFAAIVTIVAVLAAISMVIIKFCHVKTVRDCVGVALIASPLVVAFLIATPVKDAVIAAAKTQTVTETTVETITVEKESRAYLEYQCLQHYGSHFLPTPTTTSSPSPTVTSTPSTVGLTSASALDEPSNLDILYYEPEPPASTSPKSLSDDHENVPRPLSEDPDAESCYFYVAYVGNEPYAVVYREVIDRDLECLYADDANNLEFHTVGRDTKIVPTNTDKTPSVLIYYTYAYYLDPLTGQKITSSPYKTRKETSRLDYSQEVDELQKSCTSIEYNFYIPSNELRSVSA